MFEKLVAIEPVSLIPSAEEELHRYAKEVALYRDVPASDDEMVRRIGDADAVLLSYTSRMGKEVIAQCPNIRYIGMCCSLYSEESANVDIAYARTRGIQVLGIRDYGDRGVVEYVLHELTGLLHGFGMPMLRDGGDHRPEGGHRGAGRFRPDDRRCAAIYGRRDQLLCPQRKAGRRSCRYDLQAPAPAAGGQRGGIHLPEQECAAAGRKRVCPAGCRQGAVQHFHRPRLRFRCAGKVARSARHTLFLRHPRRCRARG
mgnify:CR=1 FL=1